MQISDDDLHCTPGGGDHLYTGTSKIYPVSLPSAAAQGKDVPQGQTNPLFLQERGHPQTSTRDRDSQTLNKNSSLESMHLSDANDGKRAEKQPHDL